MWARVVFVPHVDRPISAWFNDKRIQRAALLVALWLPAIAVLLVVREVLLPFLLALLFAYLLAPLVRWLSSKSVRGRPVRPWMAVLALYVAAAVVLYITSATLVPRVYRELGRLAKDGSELLNHLDDDDIVRIGFKLDALFERYHLPVQVTTTGATSVPVDDAEAGAKALTVDLLTVTRGLIRDAKAWLSSEARVLLNQLQQMVAGIVGFVFKTFLVLMLTAFIASDAERIVDFFVATTPRAQRARLRALLGRIDHGLSGVVRGQVTICLVNGVLTLAGLLLLQVKYAFLLGILAAVFSLVPIFGSILSTIPIVLMALANGPSTAVLALVWILGIHALEANLLNPKILGDAARIHPALVVLSLIVGEHYFGIVGALLAVPLMSILVTIFKATRARALELDDDIEAEHEAEHEAEPARARARGARRPPRLVGEHASP